MSSTEAYRIRLAVRLRVFGLAESQVQHALSDFDLAMSWQEGRLKALEETIAQRDKQILELTGEVSELEADCQYIDDLWRGEIEVEVSR